MNNILNWKWGGLFLGATFLLAIAFVKPIGVSTQFVITDAMVLNQVQTNLIQKDDKSYSSTNAYLNKSKGKYAKNAANPINYNYVFVIAMMFGAFLSSKLKGDRPKSAKESATPKVWRDRFGQTPKKRYLAAFIGGFLVLFGSRLAGGCTSGHMMSGMVQTALSGYLFASAVFIVAIPTALFMYRDPNAPCPLNGCPLKRIRNKLKWK